MQVFFTNWVQTSFFLILDLIALPLDCGYVLATVANLLKTYLANQFGTQSEFKLGAFGVIVHELGHAIVALLFGHKLADVKLLDAHAEQSGTLGHVSSAYNPKSWYQKLGNFFIGLAPIFSGSLVMLLLIEFTCHPDYHFENLADLHHAWANLVNGFSSILVGFWQTSWWQKILLLVLVGLLCLTVFSLSKADFKSTLVGIVPFLIVIVIIALGLTLFVSQQTIASFLNLIIIFWLIMVALDLAGILLSFVELGLLAWLKNLIN